jgi:hypothetical protein
MSRLFTTFVALASIFVAAPSLRAQAPAPAPFGAAAPAAGAAAAPPVVDDPRVKALLDSNPSTPRDLFRVIELLIQMEYPQVAKPLLTKLTETAADDAKLAELGRQFGRQAVEKLGNAPAELQPDARQTADRILEATRNLDRDPARITSLIELLKDPSFDARIGAMTSLRAGEDASVEALLTVLLDPARSAEHPQVRTALAAMDHYAVGPITAMAGAKDEGVRIAALQTAALMRDAESLAPLYGAAFAPGQSPAVRQTGEAALKLRLKKLPRREEASADLYVAARSAYLKSGAALASEPAPARPAVDLIWTWDDAARRLVSKPTSGPTGELDQAVRLARFAGGITGGLARYLHLASELELEIYYAGGPANGSKAAASWAARVKPSMFELEGLLQYTLEAGHTSVAAEIVRLLAAVGGKAAIVSPVAGKPSPLVKAATDPDRRVRYAAVESILALNPTVPFVGAGGVYDAVGYFASSTGREKALVVDVSPTRARNVGGLWASIGTVVTAESTRDAMRILSQDPDVTMVLVARQMLLPEMGAIVGQLRADYRTRRIPVAVYCGPDELERTRTLLPDDGFTAAVYEPRSFDAINKQLRGGSGFRIRGDVAPIDGAERLAQGTAMAAAAARLLDAGNTALNLRPYESQLTTAAFHPAAGKHLAPVLGKFGSAAAQRTLADVASSPALPLDQRQAAAQAFCESVVRFGTLLTKSEVLRQYERYNASESLDQPTQDLLAKMLDVIEAKAAKFTSGPTARAASLLPAVTSPAATSPAASPAAASPAAGAPAP